MLFEGRDKKAEQTIGINRVESKKEIGKEACSSEEPHGEKSHECS